MTTPDQRILAAAISPHLSGKADTVHTHVVRQIEGLEGELGKKATLADVAEMLEGITIDAAPTRSVIHPLSMPANVTLRDPAPARHVRVPVRLPCSVTRWGFTVKNHNDSHAQNFGELAMGDVYVGRRAKDANGAYTADFAETPTKLPAFVAEGAEGSSDRRYVIADAGFTLHANVEYLIAYGFENTGSESAHMGIGGAYVGTDPASAGDATANVSWSGNIPLDAYLTLAAPASTRTIAYTGSSSETGLGSPYPLRDSWGWRHAASVGALPIIMGHSGRRLSAWASPTYYAWAKLAEFDPLDELVVAAGSNDVYGGATATDVAESLAGATRIARGVAASIGYANVFPRLTETPEVRAVRDAYNEHLRTYPNGALYVVERAAAVSLNGLLRPELDSGDGVHLNATGQAILGDTARRGFTPHPIPA